MSGWSRDTYVTLWVVVQCCRHLPCRSSCLPWPIGSFPRVSSGPLDTPPDEPHHFLSTVLFSDTTDGCELTLHFPFCSLRSPAFVFVLRMVFRHQDLGTRCAHCYGGGVAFVRSEQRKLGNRCMSVTPVHLRAHICVSAFVHLCVSACVHVRVRIYVESISSAWSPVQHHRSIPGDALH